MPQIVNIFKRASSYILGYDETENQNEIMYEDNEMLFSKNNVCVHPPAIVRQDSDILHYPGYLTVTTKTFIDQYNNAKRPTLLLTWIPNSTLRKSVESNGGWTKAQNDERNFLKNSSTISTISEDSSITTTTGCHIIGQYVSPNSTNPFIEAYNEQLKEQISDSKSVNFSDYSETISIGSNSDRASTSNDMSREDGLVPSDNVDLEDVDEGIIIANERNMTSVETPEEKELKNELQPLLSNGSDEKTPILISQNSVTSVNITIANPTIHNTDLSPANMPSNDKFVRSLSLNSTDTSDDPTWMSPELLAYKHNLAFPDSATGSPVVTKKVPTKCRRFSVDLSQMRALRLFFNDDTCTSGQLVIASRESQYKILHFHYGGLDHLAQVLHQWHCLLHNIKLAPGSDEPNLPYRQFMVCRPEVKKSEMHPDEGNVNKITTDYFYGTLLNDKGQIEDDLLLRKCVFFGGLEKGLRKTVWPFLLHCYSTNSTFDERVALGDIRKHVSILSIIFNFNFLFKIK